jgi:hypothetical protein
MLIKINNLKVTRNCRGDIPITILVIGVIAVCVLTIFSFVSGADKIKQSFVGPGMIETIYSIQEEIEFNEKIIGKSSNHPYEFFSGEIKKDGKSSMKITVNEDKSFTGEYFYYEGFLNNYFDNFLGNEGKTLIEIEYTP